jgi:hypothetical protein
MRKGIKGTAQNSMEHIGDVEKKDSMIMSVKTKVALQDQKVMIATGSPHKTEEKSQEKNKKRKMNDNEADGLGKNHSEKIEHKHQDKKIKPLPSSLLLADGVDVAGVLGHAHKKTKMALPNKEEKGKNKKQKDYEDQETINDEEEEDWSSDDDFNHEEDEDANEDEGGGNKKGKHDNRSKDLGCKDQPLDGGKLKKMVTNGHAKRDRVKTTCTVSARMKQVVDQMISCSQDQYNVAIQQTTVFAFKSQQSEIITCFLEEMRRENGPLFQNKEAFLEFIANIYDHSQNLVMLHQKK